MGRRNGDLSTIHPACGVELTSRIPIGMNSSKKLGLGVPISKRYFGQHEFTSQFEGAERIAERWGITRDDADAFGLRSQELAAQAWAEGRFDTQVLPLDAPDAGEDGKALDTKALHELERTGGRYGLVSMCCGGGLGTGTLIERLG
ncbi:MAG: hypothetical protein ACR2JF_07880 [Iamia sp.]